MSLIIISADTYESGRKIAEKTAESLQYRMVGRETLAEVASRYGIPEVKLEKALTETSSLLGMPAKMQRRCLAYIREAVLGKLLADNTVCHDLAAHLYVVGISHALKVRILANVQEEAAAISKRENIPVEKVARLLEKRRQAQKRWSMNAARMDETDPAMYDLVISLGNIDPDEAVKTIRDTVAYRKFQPMTWSQKCLADLETAARVRAALFERFPEIKVSADGGTLVVEARAMKRERRKKTEAIKEMAGKIPGVEHVEVHIINDIFRQAVESFR